VVEFPSPSAAASRVRHDVPGTAEAIFEAVCSPCGLDRSALARRGDPHIARALAAWLCEVPLHELSPRLGLSRANSVPNLTRRIDPRLRSHPQLADELRRIMDSIVPGTKNKVWPQ